MGHLERTDAYRKLYKRYPGAKRKLFDALDIWTEAFGEAPRIYHHEFQEDDFAITFNGSIIQIDGMVLRYRWSYHSDLHAWYILYTARLPQTKKKVVHQYLLCCGRKNYGIKPRQVRRRLRRLTQQVGTTALRPSAVKTLL